MYTIEADGKLLYDPRILDTAIGKPTLAQEANKHGTLSFTIYPDHALYGSLRKVLSVLSVYRDGDLIYQGRPTYTKRAFRNGIEYKAEEVTARLNDFKLRPGTYSGTVEGFIADTLAEYNARADSGCEIHVGRVQNSPGAALEYEHNSYIGYWDALLDALVNAFGGYLVPRYEQNTVFLDYLTENDLPQSAQAIRFGENLTDLFIETNSDQTFSILIPTGADMDVTGQDGKTTKVPITIESVNDGKDYIMSSTGYDLVGWRETTKRWDSISDPAELLSTAQAYLASEAVKFTESVELSAVDLHNVDADIESFRFLEWVTAESTVHGLSERYVLSRITIPLGSPESATISLGATNRTLTDRIVTNTGEAGKTSNKVTAIAESTKTIQESVDELAEIIGTGENAILRPGKITRDGQEKDALILNPDWALVVENMDVGPRIS